MSGMSIIRAVGLSLLFWAPAEAALAADAAGSWTNIAPSRIARTEIQTAVVGGKIYVIGGNTFETRNGMPVVINDAGLNQVYDPAANAWRDLTPVPRGANHTAIAALGGKIYIAGGFTQRQHMNAVDWFYAYDPASDRWEALKSLSSPRGAAAMAAVGGKIHIFGGRTIDANGALATHEIYNPMTNAWSAATPSPRPRDHVGIEVLAGKIHIYGGRIAGGDSNVALHDIYDPATNTWSVAAPMPTARSNAAFAQYRGMLFFIGGECREHSFDENEAFDPRTASWRTFAKLPVGRHANAAAVVGDKLYVFGGTTECGSNGPLPENLFFSLP